MLEKIRALIMVGDACSAACDAGYDAEALRDAARQLWAAAAYVERRDPAAHDALAALADAAWWLAGGRLGQAETCLQRATRVAPAEMATREWVEIARDALAWRVEFCRRKQQRGEGAANA